MSTTPQPTAKSSAFGRYFFLFLLGLVVGAVATVMAMRTINAGKDHYPSSVMHVMDAHFDVLRDNIKQNRCAATDTLPQLQSLRTIANDIEPAFGDLREDARFSKHASDLRASLDAALASPPLNCAGVKDVVAKVGENCKGCHEEFRN